MTSDRWRRLQELFEQALALPEAEQGDFLSEATADDEELRLRVEALLVAEREATGVFSHVIEEAAAEAVVAGATVGGRVGPYRLVRELGRGGMGTVYLAERVDREFDQRVALKIIRDGGMGARVVERFLAERQILAGLEHPNIARLLDGGRSESGLPYFAMEYVDGVPIDQYCDEHRLSTGERLELFRRVCSAVELAHRKLVVHRDLKPSNILVTEAGVPKLLDFGIAKLLESDPSLPTITVVGERAMTPEYASPEQVRGQPVSTATDVYGLGLLLYELLTGRKGHRISSVEPSEVEKVVCLESPERPSTAVTEDETPLDGGSSTSSAAIGQARRSTPMALKKRLQGDLDNIVLMALRKEPERRYGSVGGFSEDVRCHLEGLPVRAHPDSFGYRARKFVGRHAVAFASALVTLSLMAGLAGYYTVRLADERDRTRVEAETSEAVATFLEGLFAIPDPSEARGNSATAREILDRGVERIETDLVDQPEVQARLMTRMGVTYAGLGLPAEAGEVFEVAYTKNLEAYGREHANTLLALGSLGNARIAAGRFPEAEEHLRQAYELSRAIQGAEHVDTIKYLGNLAICVLRMGRPEESAELQERALALRREVLGDEHPHTLGSLTNLAIVYGRLGRSAESVSLTEEALAQLVATAGEDHPNTLNVLGNLAVVLDRLGLHERAEPVAVRAVELQSRVLGKDHHRTLISVGNLAVIHGKTNRLDEAASSLEQVIDTLANAVGEEHPITLWKTRDLGLVYLAQGRLDLAEETLLRSLEARKKALGETHPETLQSHQALGGVYASGGRAAEAEEHLRFAWDGVRDQRGESHPLALTIASELGEALVAQQRLGEADALLVAATEVAREKYPRESLLLTKVLTRYGVCLTKQGRFDEAEAALADALSEASKIDAQYLTDPERAMADLSVTRTGLSVGS